MLASQNRWQVNLQLMSANRMWEYSFSETALANGIVHALGESVDAFAQVLGNFGGHVGIRSVVKGECYIITLSHVNIDELGVLVAS